MMNHPVILYIIQIRDKDNDIICVFEARRTDEKQVKENTPWRSANKKIILRLPFCTLIDFVATAMPTELDKTFVNE